MPKQRLVVIGNGMAGARTVEEILARGGAETFDIVMFGAETYGNYNRILLSSILSGTQTADEIYINPLDWYVQNAVTLHPGETVVEVDRFAKVVVSASGLREPYDTLVIATGSRPLIPPIRDIHAAEGGLRRGVFAFRTIEDCRDIAAYAKQVKRAAVIGGGLLGLEAARGLIHHGCAVDVIHLGGHLMEQQLDPTAGAMLARAMAAMGATVHLGKSTTAIHGGDAIEALEFKDGTRLPCELLVVSAGIRPNAEIGTRAGLTVERAIVVDDHMRSVDDPNVYIVGECAQHRGRVYGLVAPLWEQAKIVADQVTARNPSAAYQGSKLATKLKVMGVELAAMGVTEPSEERDEVIQFTEPKRGTYKKLIVRDGRLIGGILMGDISKAAYLMQAFDRDSQLPEERLALLFDIGLPAQQPSVDQLPPNTKICNCNGVDKATIGACVSAGRRTAAEVMETTRAGMGCGSCKGLVGELVTWLCETVSEVAAAPLGGFTPELLRRIADAAERHNVSSLRLASGGALQLLGIPTDVLDEVFVGTHPLPKG